MVNLQTLYISVKFYSLCPFQRLFFDTVKMLQAFPELYNCLFCEKPVHICLLMHAIIHEHNSTPWARKC